LFTVLHRPNDEDSARLGFAIAKKKIPAACGRNRVRRVARESFRVNRAALPCDDIIILAQTAAAAATNKDLFASLDKHWQRLRKSANREKLNE
jgi:ribonuclease P protein component